jgi:hypothetical protein
VDWDAAGFSLSGNLARGQLSGVAVTILVQPLPHGRFVFHALAEATASPSALTHVSRDLEGLRRQAEGALA